MPAPGATAGISLRPFYSQLPPSNPVLWIGRERSKPSLGELFKLNLQSPHPARQTAPSRAGARSHLHPPAGFLPVPDVANYICPLIPPTADAVLPGQRMAQGTDSQKRGKPARGWGTGAVPTARPSAEHPAPRTPSSGAPGADRRHRNELRREPCLDQVIDKWWGRPRGPARGVNPGGAREEESIAHPRLLSLNGGGGGSEK